MTNDKIAKNLLEGASCSNCRYYDVSLMKCRMLKPVKIKYPDDVQIFINGMLAFLGEDAMFSKAFIIENEVHFKQIDLPMNQSDQIAIYSRGKDKEDNYDSDVKYIVHEYKPIPSSNICENWSKM